MYFNKKRPWRIRACAMCIVLAQMMTPMGVFAEETMKETLETEVLESEVSKQQGLVENSFRYDNGELIHEGGISMFAEENADDAEQIVPWIFKDGYWRNDLGDPIPGAIEKGIDVSGHQKKIDWEKVQKTDVSFAIVRCGYGNDQEDQDDSCWKYNADECTRLGIPFGTYIYSYALDVAEAKSEADHVLRLVEGYDLSFPIFYDLEDENYTGSLTAEEIGDIAETFVTEMNKAGYEVIIYSSKYWFENVLTDSRFDQWDKWVAQYNYRCSYTGDYMMWQCASDGYVDGVDGYVDINFTIDSTQLPKPPETEEKPEPEPDTETESEIESETELETESETETETESEPEPVIPTPIEDPIGDFVRRLYEVVLNRDADINGLMDWRSRLVNQEETGAQVAWGFVMSTEFKNRKLSDEQFVDVMYKTCFDRAADAAGKEYWLSELKQGFSREYVLRGFVESAEFGKLCKSYDIVQGTINLTNIMDRSANVTRFVYRNYEAFLGRTPDETGHLYWVTKLVKKESTPKDVAYGFVFSKELLNRKLSNEQFVRVLYQGLFDREADSDGFNVWMRELKSGKTRLQVFEGFAGSKEFANLVKSFDL